MKLKLIVILTTIILHSTAQIKPVSYSDLMQLSAKGRSESISSGDRISLIVSEVLLTEFDANNPDKILEIECDLVKYDGSKVSYSIVHRQIFSAKEEGFKFDEGFFLLRDISLQDIEKIQFKITVKSINKEQAKLFQLLANLLTYATENNSTIETIRNLLKTQGELKEEAPIFDATFYIANNYINYQKVISENHNLPYLKPLTDNCIAFTSESKNIPENYLKKIGHIVVGGDLFKEREKIGGAMILKATKSTPKPLQKPVLDKLYAVCRAIKNSDINNLESLIENANSVLDIVYSEIEDKNCSAYQNASFYLSLARCYLQFQKKRDPQSVASFYTGFISWTTSKKNYFGIDDYTSIAVKDVYSTLPDDDAAKNRVVDFFAPGNLPSDFIMQCFVMQNDMHNFCKLKNDPIDIKNITYLLDK